MNRGYYVLIQSSLCHIQLLKVFQIILDLFDIDLFASNINAKCNIYVSWLPDPDSCAIDAFTISWSEGNFFVFPPFILLPRVLRKKINDKAEGRLVVTY